jgi:hypothetical protein
MGLGRKIVVDAGGLDANDVGHVARAQMPVTAEPATSTKREEILDAAEAMIRRLRAALGPCQRFESHSVD